MKSEVFINLLDKFDAVEVTVVARISEDDRKFCEAHEAAYEAARTFLQEFALIWEEICETQKHIPAVPGYAHVTYLPSRNALEIFPDAIQKHADELHDSFIENLVHYFNHRYRVEASPYPIMKKLLPEEPKYQTGHNYEEERKLYKENLRSLSLTASQILEELFAQFDGRGLEEQGLYKLKEHCHDTAWNTHLREAYFQRKKCIIRFLHYACSYKDWSGYWELSNGMNQVLRGLAHYETGGFSEVPHEISSLLNRRSIYSDLIEFTDCTKVTQIRLYKNGRTDIRFADESLARHFAEEYLGTVC